MKVKLILPALTEALSPFWRSIKYALFPPLGLATLAGYLDASDEVEIQDEHVESLTTDDEPDLVGIQVYITSARRAYRIADLYRSRGVYVVLGGLHVTALPDEAVRHADTVILGPAEDAWPQFLADFRAGNPRRTYQSRRHALTGTPPPRRDLIKRHLYLVPNSLVVSRGCPHSCDFCYKTSFFRGGASFYTQTVDAALAAIEALPGRHLFFLDDHLFADRSFATALFDGMTGMHRAWQAAATVKAVLSPGLLERAVASGLSSLFVGFETLDRENLRSQGKLHNLEQGYVAAIRRLHELGVMINASFLFGFDRDTDDVFDRTVDWAVTNGIETATFHVLTPYPGTKLYSRLRQDDRLVIHNWNLYDTRHAVFRPAQMSAPALEAGYWRAYRHFYRWSSILTSAGTKSSLTSRLRHLAYTAGWKKCEPLWDAVIRLGLLRYAVPALERVLTCGGRNRMEPDTLGERGAPSRSAADATLPAQAPSGLETALSGPRPAEARTAQDTGTLPVARQEPVFETTPS